MFTSPSKVQYTFRKAYGWHVESAGLEYCHMFILDRPSRWRFTLERALAFAKNARAAVLDSPALALKCILLPCAARLRPVAAAYHLFGMRALLQ